MAQELRTPRAINKACRAYAIGGSGHPVYATAEGYSYNIRVSAARTVGGTLHIKTPGGGWIRNPTMVFSV
jgi:phenolic acid decarboxylase